MVYPKNWNEDNSIERVVNDVWDEASGTLKTSQGSVIPIDYDYVDITYDANQNPTVIVYKKGGVGGATVMTRTMTYDANQNLETVTIS